MIKYSTKNANRIGKKAFKFVLPWIPGLLLMCCLTLSPPPLEAQSQHVAHLSAWDGMVVAGYVGHGGYANFGGPSIKWSLKPCTIALGLFPAVRIKEDKVADKMKKNSSIVPSTGFGITSSFKHLVLQIPVFYDAKSTSADGKWNLGIGIGYKF